MNKGVKMHTIKLNIQDSVFDKVIYFLKNLPSNEVEIIEEKLSTDDWSHLEAEVEKGMNSPMSSKTHEEIFEELKRKYAS
jgi:hypothetical protein